MQIESKIKRPGGTHVDMGTKQYHFAPLEDGAHVADVLDEAHQDRFLSISEGYRLYRPNQKPAAAVAVALLGSSVHEARYTIGGKDYALGDLVAAAHKNTGLSVEEWNELADDTRHGLIDDELDKLADAVTPPQDPQPPVDEDAVRAELAAQYKEKSGRAPHHTWSIDKIREELSKE